MSRGAGEGLRDGDGDGDDSSGGGEGGGGGALLLLLLLLLRSVSSLAWESWVGDSALGEESCWDPFCEWDSWVVIVVVVVVDGNVDMGRGGSS